MPSLSFRSAFATVLVLAAVATPPASAATPEETAARLEALGVMAGNKKPTAATLGDIAMVSLYGDRAKSLDDADCGMIGSLPKLQQVMISGGRYTRACLDAFAGAPGLRTVSLSGGDIEPGALAVFARTGSLESIQLGDLRGLAPADIAALAPLRGLRLFGLTYTNVSYGRTTWFDDRTLVEIAKLTAVQNLTLTRISATAKGMAAIATMPALRDLMLERGNFTEEALEPLAKSQLVGLNLSHNHRLGARAPEFLARITTLRRLDLTGTSVGGNLAPLAGLPKLESLEISQTFADAADLAALGKAPALTQLNATDMPGIDDAGVTSLAASKTLTAISITRTAVGDAGLAALLALPTVRAIYADDLVVTDAFAAAGSKSKVVNMQIGNSDLTDAGLVALVDIASLTTVSARGTRITDAGIAAAKAKRANFNVYK
jgi:hypothetical protein